MTTPPTDPSDIDLVRLSVSQTLGEDVVDIAPVSRSGRSLPDVWKVTTAHQVLAVKRQLFASMARGTSYDLLEVEAELGRLLGEAVPRVVGTDPDNDLVMLEWRGDRTLDDLCQDECRDETTGLRLVDAFCGIESAMAAGVGDLARRCFPGCEPDALTALWREAVMDVLGRFPQLAGASTGACGGKPVRIDLSGWEGLIGRMADAPPTLGAIDYNARNVVVGPDGAFTFLEFSKIGWDWPERRLVQYGTSLGAGRPDARPICLIDRASAGRYSELSADWRGMPQIETLALLDAHHLVFHVMMQARLLKALGLPASDPRRAAWPNVEERMEGTREAIRVRLSEDEAVGVLREAFWT